MYALFKSLPGADDPAQRRQFTLYLAQRMGPLIHALMLVSLFAYLLATAGHAFVGTSPIPLPLRLAPALPLLLLATTARREKRPLPLSLLALSCVLLLEIGVNLNGIDQATGPRLVMPGLLLPVATSVIWIGRWDFLAAMALCAFGPLPPLLGATEGAPVFQYAVYMTIALSVAVVLRAFMTRTLFEQFRLEQQLRVQANTDNLTGLLLRNRFLELARLALDNCLGQRKPACLLYLDADRFKQINDDHGHAVGDAVLIALAACLRAQLRDTGLIGRMGGEEFAVLLPGVDLAQATLRGEQLRLSTHAVQRPDGPLTISIGIAECQPAGDGIEALLARADKAMRQAKQGGRNRVAVDDAACRGTGAER
ncbi:MAG: GGDEF domain-containing protein [Xanthomonadaceae bacterium]|jgi:diguanylate cyclase (GGDEF)-like protein|nr:GGDEF domain-containing protein [Xanthomonadaceae bacterium]MDE3073407.1 GGDEF domain-containing protein [Pseudomonadota bacterium]